MLRKQNSINEEQLEHGITQLKKWYPDEADKIDRYKKTIIDYHIYGVDIPSEHPIWQENHATAPKIIPPGSVILTPCHRGEVAALTESITFLFMVAGFLSAGRLSVALDRYITSALFEVAKYESEIQPLLTTFAKATGSLEKANALAPIAAKLWGYGILRGSFDVIKAESTWAEWLLDASIGVAQITVWAASEFVAAVAELAAVILSAVHLILTIEEAVKVCGWVSHSRA